MRCAELRSARTIVNTLSTMNIKNIILSASFIAFGGIGLFAATKKEVTPPAPSKIYWNDAYGKVYYNTNANLSPVVKIAVDMFSNDMKNVLGYPAKEKANATIQIFQLDQLTNKEFAALQKLGTPLHQIITKNDAFWIGTRQGKLIVVGSNARGTAYGILELSKLSGVSPWTDYSKLVPLQKKTLSTETGFESLQIPSTEYRGLMLNNSAWMGSKNQSNLCKLMLRLKANMLWEDDDKQAANYDKAVTDSFDILVAENGKVTENVIGKKHNKKHKKSIEKPNIFWEDSNLSFSSMSPSLLLTELQEDFHENSPHKGKSHKAYGNHEDEAWIGNVTNPTNSAYQLSLFMELAWNKNAVTLPTLEKHLANWLSEQFGERYSQKILPILGEYYHLTNIRPTEYMAMPYGDSEFHSGEFGNELERYLYDFDQLKAKVDDIENSMPKSLKTGFLQTIKLPIYISALTAEKELEAQEARHIARPGLFEKDDEAKAAASLSLNAYQKLKQLDPSATPPVLPGTLSQAEIEKGLQDAFDRQEDLKPLSYSQTKDIIAKNAYQWTSISLGKNDADDNKTSASVTTIPYMGHSNKAVALPKGASLNYVVNSDMEGDARFTLAAIPDYTGRKGEMRVSVSIDHADPIIIPLKDAYNHSAWKMDVWRGQIRKSFYVTLGKGNHTVEIQALDNGIILDQWILDYDVDREYYVIPIR